MDIDTRGSITKDKNLSQITWLRVGGPADLFFMPADTKDLIDFLKILPKEIGNIAKCFKNFRKHSEYL